MGNFGIGKLGNWEIVYLIVFGKYPGNFSKDMLQKNVILRSETYPDGKWAMVSLGTMDEMKQFISLMKAGWQG